ERRDGHQGAIDCGNPRRADRAGRPGARGTRAGGGLMPQAHEEWEASRRLLRRVRDVMAAGGSAQVRLDRVVRVIATEMVAEVCSIYIRRAGNVLLLVATQGLKQEAIGVTRLGIGEGLVGLIAEQAQPVALADAQAHPHFAYRPETGEE